MATGVIESISKTSLVVTTADKKTITLIGQPAEAFALNSKLGDAVEFTLGQDGTTATKISKASPAAAPAPAAKTRSNSPTEKQSVMGQEKRSSW